MAITGHFIDDSWKLKSIILRFIYVPAPHTAEALSNVLVESLMDWNIDRKLSTITVDNCTTNDSMINHILRKLSSRDMLLDGKVLHMRCSAHILNLIVRDGMDIIATVIDNVRDSVLFWTASPARIEKFEETARQLHVDCTRKLVLDCKTRWNSTYLMLETAIVYRRVFTRLKCREKSYSFEITDKNWDDAVEICDKLKIFYLVTEKFSGTLYPTSNFYFANVCEIKTKLDAWVSSDSEIVQKMASKMMGKYDKYWTDCHIMLGVAAVLDPRYKLKLVEFYFNLIYGDRAAGKVEQVRKNCQELLNDYESRSLLDDNSLATIGSLDIGGTSQSKSTADEAYDLDPLNKFDQFISSNSSGISTMSELDIYLEESVLPRTTQFDILGWWKTNGVKYHFLQKMAKDILAIPVSTVASEATFSNSGRIISPHRSRLNPSTLEALVCGRRWLWNEVNGGESGDSKECPTIVDEEEDE